MCAHSVKNNRMKAIFKHIVALLLGLIVLFSTSGFTVFKHYCHTENTTELSFIVEDFDCDHKEHEHQHGIPPCCTMPERERAASCSDVRCCDTERHFYKLNITLDIQELTKKAPPVFTADSYLNQNIFDRPAKEDDHFIISNDLPPPLSGKALHIYLLQLKFDC